MRTLVAQEPHRADLTLDLAIRLWNLFTLVTARNEGITFLRLVLDTLKPLRVAGSDNQQVGQLWDMASRALAEREQAG